MTFEERNNLVDIARHFDLAYAAIDLLCGDLIGQGLHRMVYDCPIMPGHVVKVETDNGGHNLNEYKLYWALKGTIHEKYLAPVKWMSDNGRMLIMQKAQPITSRNEHMIPYNVPHWFTDMKHSNYGFIRGRFVCVDYSFSLDACAANVREKYKRWKSHVPGENGTIL